MSVEEKKKREPTLAERKKAYDDNQKQIKMAERRKVLLTARGDLIDFTNLMMPHPDDPDDVFKSRYSPQKHHRVIAAALEAVERNEILRLIITMPPRAGKSQLAAKSFIPWVVGRDPYKQIIFTTYSQTFAEDTGRAVRDTMKGTIYRQIFPGCVLRAGSAAADRVQTEEGGIIVSVGAGGALTGRGADLLLIDDPIKDREQADSAGERNKMWEWFTSVAMTRLMTAGSAVVIIMTRWHEDDLVGRLIDPTNPCYNKEEAENWKILALPAIAEDNDPMGRVKGEPLWAERFPLEFLERTRKMDARGFSALYQGRPSPDDGDFFLRKYISYYKPEELPKNLRFYAASDHAVSERQRADRTCLISIGIDEDDNIYVLPELFWERADAEKTVEGILKIMRLRKPIFWWAENGHISKSLGPFLRKRMKEEKIYSAIIEQTPSKDKRTRAQSIQARMSMGKVFFPLNAWWTQDAVAELLKFPAGRHDDFVDALAWVGIGLNLQNHACLSKNSLPEEYPHGTFGWLKQQMKLKSGNKSKKDGF